MKKVFIKLMLLGLLFAPLSHGAYRAEKLYDPIISQTAAVWVDTRSKTSTIEALITSIGATDTTLLVNTAETFVADDTIPATIKLVFTPSGSFSVPTTKNLTIQTTNIEAANHDIFSGAGDFDFADGTVLKSSWFTSFEAGLTYIGATDIVTYIVTEDHTLTASDEVTSNITLQSISGNILSDGGGAITLTINGTLEISSQGQIFNWTGSGNIIYGSGSIEKLYAAWYGFEYGSNDATQAAENNTAIDLAIAHLKASLRGGIIQLPRGKFVCTPDIIVNFDHITIQGVGEAAEYGPTETNGTVLEFTEGNAGSMAFDITYSDGSAGSYNRLKDLTISGNSVLDYGVEVSGMVAIENVNIIGCTEAAFWLVGLVNQTWIENCSAINNKGGAGIGLYIAQGAGPSDSNTIMSINNFNSRSNIIGVKIENARKLIWNNGVIETNTNEGMILYKPTGGSLESLTFNGLWFENNNAGTSNYQVTLTGQVPGYANGPTNVKFDRCHFNNLLAAKNLYVESSDLLVLEHCTSEAGAGVEAILFDTYSYRSRISNIAYNHVAPKSIDAGLLNYWEDLIPSQIHSGAAAGWNPDAIYPSALYVTKANITKGSAGGLTVNNPGSVLRHVYKATVNYTGLAAAATNSDMVIATLPAKTRVVSVIADTTTKYTGGDVSAATLQVGHATIAEFITAHDVLSAAVTSGLADADLGTGINNSNNVQGGSIPSWTATTAVNIRLVTTGANTNALTQGSTTFYIITERMQ